MEPAPKRMRWWRPEQPSHSQTLSHKPQQPQALPVHNAEEVLLPTRTIDLSDFRRRAFHAYRSGDGGSNQMAKTGTMYLMPRAQAPTTTATLFAIFDQVASTIVTNVTAPAGATALNLEQFGTVTIPDANSITSTTESTSLTSTESLSSEISTPSIISSSISAGLNSTSGIFSTPTITSTITVVVQNGTAVVVPTTTTGGLLASTVDTSSITSGIDDGVLQTLVGGGAGSNSPTIVLNGAVSPTTPTSQTPSATSTEPAGGGVTLTPQQQQVVGGVVGGVAGVALVLVALLYFLKWYRQRLKRAGRFPEQMAVSSHIGDYDDDGAAAQPQMLDTNRNSIGPIAAVASRLKQLRSQPPSTIPVSSDRSLMTTGAGERSFQRVAGRKIPPVLSYGGDGYGGDYGVFGPLGQEQNDSQISVYRDDFVNSSPFASQTFPVSGPTTPTRTDPFTDPPSLGRESYRSHRPFSPTTNFSRPTGSRDFGIQDQRVPPAYDHRPQFSPVSAAGHGYAALRPSPARTPVTQSPMSSTVHLPQPSSTPPLMAGNVPNLPTIPKLDLPPRGKRDREGRSVSNDAASASRLGARSVSTVSGRTSSTGGRFREDI